MSRPLPTESALLRGPEGQIEVLIDTPETVRERLRVYAEQTEPVAGYFGDRGKLVVAGRARLPARGCGSGPGWVRVASSPSPRSLKRGAWRGS